MTNKIGVYFPFNRALFGRLGMAQLLRQTRKPDFLVMLPNGPIAKLMDSLADYTAALSGAGVDVSYISHPGISPVATLYRIPLTQLLGEDCQWFIKWDQDDIYRDNFLEQVADMVERCSKQHEWVGFAKNGALVEGKEPRYVPSVSWASVNPLGAASTCLTFNRRVAQMYSIALLRSPQTPDDVTLAKILKTHEGMLFPWVAPYVHVSHGANLSTAKWMDKPPAKVFSI